MRVDLAGDVATISLDQPETHNAMGTAWPSDLMAALDRAVAGAPKVIVVRGEGPSFCSGVNTKDFAAGRLGPEWFRAADEALLALDRVAVPTVACVHGYCLGGGLQLASVCDIRIVDGSARLGLPAVTEGLVPGMSFLRLSRLIGAAWAADLILSGEVLTAERAAAAGLATRVAPAGGLDEELRRLVEQIRPAPARAIARSKQLLTAVRLDGHDAFAAALHETMQELIPLSLSR